MLKSRGEKIFNVINITIMLILFAIFIFPYIIIISSSFSGERALAKYGPGFFIRDFSFASYLYIFSAGSTVLRSLGVSVYITLVTTVLSVLVNALLAYPLSRHDLFGKKILNIYVVITMLFGGGMVPFYLLIEDLNLLNNLWSLILPVVVSAWNIILLRNYFAALPDSLEESAKIEGAGNVRILFEIYIPLSASVIATVALFAAVNQWNSWTTARLFIDPNHSELYPIQYVIRNMIINMDSISSGAGGGASSVPQIGVQNAAIIVATLPIVCVYPFLQKYFINGTIVGAVKE